MVFSVKANKKKILAVLVILAIIVCGVLFLPKMIEAPAEYLGETNEQRIQFLESYGWDVSEEPIDSRDVTIPKEFSEVYLTYNIMQNAQGFDLLPYSGAMCKQYVYQVLNYPGQSGQILATLLVYEGKIIGGDISCSDANGFMHGFDIDSPHYGETEGEAADPTPEATTPDDSDSESSAPESSTTDESTAPESSTESSIEQSSSEEELETGGEVIG